MISRSLNRPWRAVALFVPLLAMAQVETARITGTVTDRSDAVIPGATITITHVATSTSISARSDSEGRYVSGPLRIGEYRVEAEATGFKRAVRSGILLEIQQTALVDLKLDVGALTETVSVTSDAPLLATADAAQGQVINNRKIVDLPLNGRDYVQLALLSAGTIQPPASSRFGGFSVAGQRTTENNYLLDGIDNNNMQIAANARRAEAVKPSVDAIQEFRVATNSYSAEYGRAAGGVVNVSIKSGSNEVHGTAFEFLRNEKLDAKNFFDDPQESKPPFKRNQYGFSLGGPLQKNKTFLFGDYEATRIRESSTILNTIPTLAQREGDFSGAGKPIFDPQTYDARTRSRQPFPGNVIPAARVDPIARQAAAWYPKPQNDALTANFLFTPPLQQDINKFDVRADRIVNGKDTVYYRFSFQRDYLPGSPNLPPPAFGGGNTANFAHNGRNMAFVWNHVFSPVLVNSSRVGWNQTNTLRSPGINYNVNAQLGLRGLDEGLAGAPAFNISGVTTLGIGANVPNIIDSQTRQLVSDTTWNKGSHSVKFGINIYWLQSYLNNPQNALGAFTFNGNFTRNPAGNAGGQPFADFLLGIPFRTDLSTFTYMNLRAPWYHFYVQDEWRATRHLTLNAGLRYELNLPWVEKRNGMGNFDIDTNPAKPQWRLAANGSRLDRATMTTDTTNFAPRFGFAYQLHEKLVLRGGYGIYIATAEATDGTTFLQTNPPYTLKAQITTDSLTPAFYLRDGVPGNVLVPEKATNLVFSSFERDPQLPFSQQWNFNIQYEPAKDLLVEAGYYGAKSNHLVNRWNANYALPGPGNINTRRRYPSIGYPGTNLTIGPLAALNRHDFNGNSVFHSLQTKVERRLSKGFTLLASYVFSKTIGDVSGFPSSGTAPGAGNGFQNPLNRRLERSVDDQNMKHRIAASYVYDLPFGYGRSWGGNWNRAVDALLGGWSAGGITTLASGLPMSLTVRGDPANTGDVNRPNVVGDPGLSRSERSLQRFFNTAAFVPNAPFTYGNAGRNILEQPGTVNFDFAAYKRFRVTEAVALQFRFEVFNLLNTPQFDPPNLEVGNDLFGRIDSAGRPRNLQFGLKLIF